MTLLALGFGDLPAVNASLNALSTLFLGVGWWHIRHGRRDPHRRFMLAAVTTSVLFLVSYVVYHSTGLVTEFRGEGAWRPVYFTILISHVVLAAVLPILVGVTLVRALRERFDAHRRLARWTLPIWLYVSVTGVIIYWMLYRVTW